MQDKQQAAELDPGLFGDGDIFEEEEPEPCLVCGKIESHHEVMFCDACDHTVHVFCAGYQDAPEEWYCETCPKPWETTVLPRVRVAAAPLTRPHPSQRRQRTSRIQRAAQQPRQTAAWARVWQTVWNRLNLDLDFPYDESDNPANPTEQHRARAVNEAAWRRRYNVASQQGAARNFRATAPPVLDPGNIESQEELRAWNALDKARELQGGEPSTSRRKRNAATASPRSAATPPPQDERPFKRPRTKQSRATKRSTAVAESSSQALLRSSAHGGTPVNSSDGPNFFSALVDEVEQQPITRPMLPEEAVLIDGQLSPPLTSPAASPLNIATPLEGSTPPPLPLYLDQAPSRSRSPDRPISPMQSDFSPYSPVQYSATSPRVQTRGRDKDLANSPSRRNNTSLSPSSHLSYSTKTEIQRMVKAALGSRYKDKRMTKDQYTVINRDVSRMLYDEIGDTGALSEQVDRDKWQSLASNAVARELEKLERSEKLA